MSDKTSIEWTRSDDGTPGATWNPIRGCRRVSEGCRHCYAERVAARFSGPGQPYEGLAEMTPSGPRWTGAVRLIENVLNQPLQWKRPRRIFVNSMSDLFYEGLTDDDIWRIFAVMAAASQHTFQILTKRAERMQTFLSDPEARYKLDGACDALAGRMGWCHADNWLWPLSNVWIGISVEDQRTADERIPHLLKTPAAIRWISAEPLLGPVNLMPYLDGLDWIVAGGESGPEARPVHIEWLRSLRDQCQKAEVAFFFKQWGEYIPRIQISEFGSAPYNPSLWGWRVREEWLSKIKNKDWGCLDINGNYLRETTTWNGNQNEPEDDYEITVYRVGKVIAGRSLDGQEWNEYPV